MTDLASKLWDYLADLQAIGKPLVKADFVARVTEIAAAANKPGETASRRKQGRDELSRAYGFTTPSLADLMEVSDCIVGDGSPGLRVFMTGHGWPDVVINEDGTVSLVKETP